MGRAPGDVTRLQPFRQVRGARAPVASRRASSRASRPPGLRPRLPLRPRRRAHPDGDGALRRLEAHLRRVPASRTSPGRAEFSQLDYNRYVDGKPRADGVRDFLASRGITLPEGAPDDPPDAATVQGIATRKNELVLAGARGARRRGLPGLGRLPAGGEGGRAGDRGGHRVGQRRAGHRRRPGSPTSSTSGSTASSPPATGCAASRRRTPSWPAPACWASSRREAVVFEDALSGVAAGRAGNFGYVVGVDRVGQADELAAQRCRRRRPGPVGAAGGAGHDRGPRDLPDRAVVADRGRPRPRLAGACTSRCSP